MSTLTNSGTPSVDYPTAKRRALSYLLSRFKQRPGQFSGASAIAGVIWPNHQMKAQGAGAAASRILRRMTKDGLVRWDSSATGWGYVITSTGRIEATRE